MGNVCYDGDPLFTLGFYNPEYGQYDWLEDADDVAEALMEEIQKAVSDMGSDGYDLPDFPANFDELPLNEQEDITQEAHQKGIDDASRPHFNRIFAGFSAVLNGEADEADDHLPDGTQIYLRPMRMDD